MKKSKHVFLFIAIFIAIILTCFMCAICADYNTNQAHIIYKLRQLEPDPKINRTEMIGQPNAISTSQYWFIGYDNYLVIEHIGLGEKGGTTILDCKTGEMY